MGAVVVRTVTTRRDQSRMIRFPWKVYAGDPYWVPPLLFDMQNQLDLARRPEKHPFFEFGEAEFFIAERDGEIVGRVVAHVNRNHDAHYGVHEGFFGFYECLDDPEAARALMSAVEGWLRPRGVTRIIGPESYTVYDEIGFLCEGWENEPRIPVMMEMYTPRYYLDQMAACGYVKEIDWLALKVPKDTTFNPLFHKLKARLGREGFTFRNIDMKKLDAEIPRIEAIVNASWAANWGHVPYTKLQFDHIAKALAQIIDPRIVYMCEKDGEPVGCSLSLPDINPGVRKMNGRLFPFGWWHFLRAKKTAVGMRTFLLGVRPEYRNKGIDAVFVVDTMTDGVKCGYQWSDCSLLVETNRAIIDPVLKWGGQEYRKYRLFSKAL